MNVKKARETVQFCGVLSRVDDKPSKVFVPASPVYEGRQRGVPRCSEVDVSRDGNIMTVDCRCMAVYGDGEMEKCEGMKNGHLCYHALAAALVCAVEVNKKVNFHETRPAGPVGILRAAYGGGEVYMTYS